MDLICFSHLRWNFVYQRPQHLMTRFARNGRVFVIEEPFMDAPSAYNEIKQVDNSNVYVITPHITPAEKMEQISSQRALLALLIEEFRISDFISWYYSPLALEFSDQLQPTLTVYDCMDELSAFKFAPKEIVEYEKSLFKKADIVFTGGHHLFEAKQTMHKNIHAFPSSIDKDHFAQARNFTEDPSDQAQIPHPRIGFYGVIDERFNIELLNEMADARPDLHFILLGPTAKIDRESLPKKDNIHLLGQKNYDALPSYLAGWDIAMMPFALNESTKYISPTKTPEYLAGGKPVVSTSIRDVVFPYGNQQLVYIADDANDFIKAIENGIKDINDSEWLEKVDLFLADMSWDKTYEQMEALIQATLDRNKNSINPLKSQEYV